MNRRRVVILGVLALLAPVMPARGADELTDVTKLTELSMEELMEIKIPTVFGASKHEQKINDAPASITIVNREEIQAFGHRTLADILRSVRDVYVVNDRNYGHIGVRGINRPGDFGGRILVLVDGLRLNDPIYDSTGVLTDFPVDVDLIERVEVIRGPGSTLYGNNAFLAVINVITRRAGDVNGLEVSGEAGSLGTYKGRLTYGKVFNSGLSLLLTGTLFDSEGDDSLYIKEFDRPGNDRGRAEGLDADSFESAGVTLNYLDFTFQGGYVSRRKDVPTAAYGTIFNDPRFHTLDERSFARLSYAHEFDHDLSVRASIYRNSYAYSADYPFATDPEQPRRATINRDTIDAQWWGAELQVSKLVHKSHRLTLGMEYQDNSRLLQTNYDISPHFVSLDLDTATSTLGLYLQDEWAITRQLALNAGLRYDWYEAFGGTFNPRSALIWKPVEKTTLKLLYGEAYRVPNAYESSYEVATFRVNPDLEPEQVRSTELVLEQALTPSLRLSASGYCNRIKDLISEREDTAAHQGFFDNGGLAETKGGSAELEAKLPNGIKGRVSYSLQHTVDAVTHERFSNSPEHLAKFSLMFPLFREKVFSGFELQYSSETENLSHQRTGGYLLANWTLFSRAIAKNLEVSASVYNLFDRQYGFPGGPEHVQPSIGQDGRSFRVKLTYRF